jgi:hypothetical protein
MKLTKKLKVVTEEDIVFLVDADLPLVIHYVDGLLLIRGDKDPICIAEGLGFSIYEQEI